MERLSAQQYNVVLLDLGLPDSDGIVTLEAVHADSSDVPIFFVTGNDDNGLAIQALANGAHSFLRKTSLSAATMINAMRHAVSQHRSGLQQPAYSELKVKRLFVELRGDLAKIKNVIAKLETCKLDLTGRDALVVVRSETSRLSTRDKKGDR